MIKLEDLLSSMGVRVLNPIVTFYKPRKDRMGKYRARLEPIFPGYMFIYFDYKKIHFSTIVRCPGVNYFIKFGGNIATVSDSVIKGISENTPFNITTKNSHGKSDINNFDLRDSICRIHSESSGEKRAALFIAFIDALQKNKTIN